MDDATLLAAALDLDPRPLAAPLAATGGLAALWAGRGEALEEHLPTKARARLAAWIELTERALAAPPGALGLESAADVHARFGDRLALLPHETFWTLLFDAHGRVLGEHRVAEGTLDACLVHPREVFAVAIRQRAHHLVVVHNHPSGDPSPSEDDVALTERLTRAGQLLGIPLVDHVIVARAGYCSVGVAERPPHRRRKAG